LRSPCEVTPVKVCVDYFIKVLRLKRDFTVLEKVRVFGVRAAYNRDHVELIVVFCDLTLNLESLGVSL
jgi:hypothetical protein